MPDEQGKVVFWSTSPKKVVLRDMLHSIRIPFTVEQEESQSTQLELLSQ